MKHFYFGKNTPNKDFTYLLFYLLICFVSCAENENLKPQQEQETIYLTEAGTLPNKISFSKMYNQITNLKIVGEINGTDLHFIRDVSRYGSSFSILDLSKARIVEGGDAYYDYCYTSNNQLGDNAFSSCSSLTNIRIPLNVTVIGKYAFDHCASLTSMYIPSSVTKIGDFAFWDCESLTSVIISSGVTEIGKYAFHDCTSLKKVNIPTNVTEIEENTFSGCTSLKGVEIPSNVTKIGDSAFWDCGSLTSINIPSNLTSIGKEAFSGCKSLKSIYVYAEKVPTTKYYNLFRGCDSKNCIVYVPKGTYDAYSRSEFGYFENIIEFDTTSIHNTKATVVARDTTCCIVNDKIIERKY